MVDPEQPPNDAKRSFLGPGRPRLAAHGPGLVASPLAFLPAANFKYANRRLTSLLKVNRRSWQDVASYPAYTLSQGGDPGAARPPKNHPRPAKKPKMQVTPGHRNTSMVDHEQPPNGAKRSFLGPGRPRLAADCPGLVVRAFVFLPAANFKCASRRLRSLLKVNRRSRQDVAHKARQPAVGVAQGRSGSATVHLRPAKKPGFR